MMITIEDTEWTKEKPLSVVTHAHGNFYGIFTKFNKMIIWIACILCVFDNIELWIWKR